MKNLIIPSYLMFLFLFSGCVEDQGSNAIVVSLGMEIAVLDSEQNNLLDPDHPNAIDESKIRIYYVRDGEPEEVFDGRLDAPRNFFTHYHEVEEIYMMRLFLGGDYPIGETIIKWNESESDTITAEFNKFDNGGIILIKAWYKGDLVYDMETADNVAFMVMEK